MLLIFKENPVIRIFCISKCFAVPINPDKWSSTAGVSKFDSPYCAPTFNSTITSRNNFTFAVTDVALCDLNL